MVVGGWGQDVYEVTSLCEVLRSGRHAVVVIGVLVGIVAALKAQSAYLSADLLLHLPLFSLRLPLLSSSTKPVGVLLESTPPVALRFVATSLQPLQQARRGA